MEDTKTPLPTVSQFMSDSWALLRTTIGKQLGLLLLAISPIIALIIIGVLLTGVAGVTTTGTDGSTIIVVLMVLLGLIGLFGFLYMGSRAGAGLIYLVYSDDQSRPLIDYWNMGRTTWWSMFWRHFMLQLVISGGVVLLLIPGMIFRVMFGFATPAYLLQPDTYPKLRDAMSRSRGITQGYKWGVFGRTVLVGFMIMAPVMIAATLLVSGSIITTVLAVLVIIAAAVIGLPFMIASHAVLYRQLTTLRPTETLPVSRAFIVIFVILGIIYSVVSQALPYMINTADTDLQSTQSALLDNTSWYPNAPAKQTEPGCTWEQYSGDSGITVWRQNCDNFEIPTTTDGELVSYREPRILDDYTAITGCWSYYDRDTEQVDDNCVIKPFTYTITDIMTQGPETVLGDYIAQLPQEQIAKCSIQEIYRNNDVHKSYFQIVFNPDSIESLFDNPNNQPCGPLGVDYSENTQGYFVFDDRAIQNGIMRYVYINPGFAETDHLFDIDSIAF